MLSEQARLEYYPLSQLRGWPRNPKLHDVDNLHVSFNRFGFVSPLIIDERTGRLVAGHGRLEVLDEMRERGESPPARILVRNGEWLIPVVRGLSFKDEKEGEAYLLTDNQLTISLGFDEKLLAEILPEHATNTVGLGFSQDQLKKYLPEFRTIELQREDEIPELPTEPTTRTGDVWQLGYHRIYCGNCVQLLESQEQVDLVLTDPPYGQAGSYGRSQLGHRQVAGDETLEWLPTFAKESERLLPDNSACLVFGQWRSGCKFIQAFEAEGFRTRTVAIWDKKNSGLASHGFGEQYEQIYVFYKGQPKLDWFRGNVFEYPRVSGRPEHPTAKPVELILELMSLFPGQTVLDPFLGIGSTLIAAEKLGRTCIGYEIDPHYVDCSVQRWERYTGRNAQRC